MIGTSRRKPTPASGVASVSVVIPNFNYGRFLSECLDSVLSQTGVTLEVIVVDDASTDDSVEILRRYARKDSRITVIEHATNQGHIATFNECYNSGSFEYLVKLDADDLLTPGQLARSTALMQAHPSVGFSYGHVVTFTERPPQQFASSTRSWSVWDGQQWLAVRCRRGRNVIRQPEAILRRATLEQVGGHSREIPASSDLNLWLRLAAVADVGRVNGSDQGCYRVHGGSMQRTIHAGLLADLESRRDAFELFFADSGQLLRNRAVHEAALHRALAIDALTLAQECAASADSMGDGAQAYLTIAKELDPSIAQSRQWRALHRAHTRQGAAMLKQVGAVRRDIQDRLRWRYEQRTGL